MPKLSDSEIESQLDALGGLARQNEMLVKRYQFPSFPAAIAFVTHIGFLAEAAAHHPDLDIRYNKVNVALTTHDAGGISDKDFALAIAIDEIML